MFWNTLSLHAASKRKINIEVRYASRIKLMQSQCWPGKNIALLDAGVCAYAARLFTHQSLAHSVIQSPPPPNTHTHLLIHLINVSCPNVGHSYWLTTLKYNHSFSHSCVFSLSQPKSFTDTVMYSFIYTPSCTLSLPYSLFPSISAFLLYFLPPSLPPSLPYSLTKVDTW